MVSGGWFLQAGQLYLSSAGWVIWQFAFLGVSLQLLFILGAGYGKG